jgi:hypothetical protein
MATAQPTLALHTQQFVDSLAGAPPIYTLSPGGAQSLLGPGTVHPGRQARCAIPKHYQYDLNLPDITEVWRRGSVIASWLLDLSAAALINDPALSGFAGRVSDFRRRPVDHQSHHRRRRAGACSVICPL